MSYQSSDTGRRTTKRRAPGITGRMRRRSVSPLLGLTLGVLAMLLYWPGVFGYCFGLRDYASAKPFRTVDLRIGDMLHRKFTRSVTDRQAPRICIVAGTEEGISDFGPPPWPEAVHARLVKQLDKMGAAVIAFDFVPPPAAGGNELAGAVRESGRVILPQTGFMLDPIPTADLPGNQDPGPMLSTALRSDRPSRWRDGVYRLPLRGPSPALARAARGFGHVSLFYDEDMVGRRIPALVGDTRDKRAYIPLAVAAHMAFQNMDITQCKVTEGQLDTGDPASRIPLDDDGAILVNFRPVYDIVDMRPYELRSLDEDSGGDDDSLARPVQFFGYADVLQQDVPANAFKGAIVLVGQCVGSSREEMRITPVGSQYNVVVQAMLLHSLVTGTLLKPAGPLATVLGMLILSTAVGTVMFGLRFRVRGFRAVFGGVLILLLGVALVLLGAGLMRRAGWVIEATPFLLVIGLNLAGTVILGAARMSEEADRRNREMDMLLVAGRRHLSEMPSEDRLDAGAIPGSSQMAMSVSLSQRTPDVVAETFWQTLPCEGCVLFVVTEDTSLSFGRAVFHGFHGGLTQQHVEALAVRFAWEALKEGRTLMRSRRGRDWIPAHAPDALHTMMAIPVIARGQPLAVAILLNKLPTASSPEKEFTEDDLRLAAAMRYQAAALLENARRYQHEYAMFDGFARALAKAVDYRDRYTRGHSERVARLSAGIAEELGLNKDEIEVVIRAAILHDLGKIGVSDTVLRKPGRLTAEEFALIRTHTANGYDILSATPSFEPLLPGIRHHHERFDGLGYPDNLSGKEIPLLARIIAAADAYDAMTSDRPYRKALPETRARTELVGGAGTQFDPLVVEAFLRYIDKRRLARETSERVAATPLPDPSETPSSDHLPILPAARPQPAPARTTAAQRDA